MTIPEKAARFMEQIAADDAHGYDQASRWGQPDYDCSSLVISAYKHAGVPLQSTYTGNMKADFLSHGFENVTSKVNLKTGANMKRGDVLLNEVTHTAMYIGNGEIVHAAGNEYGRATGGKPGDQTGKEITVANAASPRWAVPSCSCTARPQAAPCTTAARWRISPLPTSPRRWKAPPR